MKTCKNTTLKLKQVFWGGVDQTASRWKLPQLGILKFCSTWQVTKVSSANPLTIALPHDMHDTIQYLYVKINKVVVIKLLCLKELCLLEAILIKPLTVYQEDMEFLLKEFFEVLPPFMS